MRLIRLKEVLDKVKLSRSTVYEYMSKGKFPRSVCLGPRVTCWVEAEINDWIHSERQFESLAMTTRTQSALIDQIFTG